jgi:hypothetical protein
MPCRLKSRHEGWRQVALGATRQAFILSGPQISRFTLAAADDFLAILFLLSAAHRDNFELLPYN